MPDFAHFYKNLSQYLTALHILSLLAQNHLKNKNDVVIIKEEQAKITTASVQYSTIEDIHRDYLLQSLPLKETAPAGQEVLHNLLSPG